MSGLLKKALHPFGPVGAQAGAQGLSLGMQLGLVFLLGEERFASLALGLLAATSVVFIGEAGFGAFFLRESARNPHWGERWRATSLTRLLILGVATLCAALALCWAAPEPEPALLALAFSSPGIALSMFNPAPVLFGTGRVRLASASILARFTVQSGVALGVVAFLPALAPVGVGSAFSLGLLTQVLCGALAKLPPHFFRPRFHLEFPPGALPLWGVALLGTVNDRLLAFLLGNAAPPGLATALIVLQVLQAFSGLAAQIDRVLVPAAANGPFSLKAQRPLAVLFLGCVVLIGTSVIVFCSLFTPDLLTVMGIFLIEWILVLLGAPGFSIVFARGQERRVIRFMLYALPVSILLQVALVHVLSLESAMLLRIVILGWTIQILARCLLKRGS